MIYPSTRVYRTRIVELKAKRLPDISLDSEKMKPLYLDEAELAAPMRKDAKRSASERRSGKKAEPRLARHASCNDIVIWEGSSPQSCGTFGEKASNFHEQSRSEV
jgi:hypothetical protein